MIKNYNTNIKNFTIFPDYLPNDLRTRLLEIALINWEQGKVNYQPCKKRGYFNLNDRYPEYLQQVNILLLNIMKSFEVPDDCFTGARHFIGINLPTSFVTPHVDKPQFVANYNNNMENWLEIRYNTFLQRPEGGGVPIIDKTSVPLDEGKSLAFRADVQHSTTPVKGNIVRVMFSIGSLINPKSVNFLKYN